MNNAVKTELARIKYALTHSETNTPQWNELYAAQQALEWAANENVAKAPYTMILERFPEGRLRPDTPPERTPLKRFQDGVRISLDGNSWVAHTDENLQEGVCHSAETAIGALLGLAHKMGVLKDMISPGAWDEAWKAAKLSAEQGLNQSSTCSPTPDKEPVSTWRAACEWRSADKNQRDNKPSLNLDTAVKQYPSIDEYPYCAVVLSEVPGLIDLALGYAQTPIGAQRIINEAVVYDGPGRYAIKHRATGNSVASDGSFYIMERPAKT